MIENLGTVNGVTFNIRLNENGEAEIKDTRNGQAYLQFVWRINNNFGDLPLACEPEDHLNPVVFYNANKESIYQSYLESTGQ